MRGAGLILLLTLASCHDPEFMDPTHTPTIQFLSPLPSSLSNPGCLSAHRPFIVVVAAPEGSRVSLSISSHSSELPLYGEGFNTQHHWTTVSVNQGGLAQTEVQTLGLSPGLHTMTARITHLPPAKGQQTEGVDMDEAQTVLVCDCGGEECPRGEVALPMLENPLWVGGVGRMALRHHSILGMGFGWWEGRLEKGYLVDWLGVRTKYAWDCIKGGGYYIHVPSRKMQCLEHDRQTASGEGSSAGERSLVRGFLPPVDDEYPELVDMLRSVVRSQGMPYVVVEIGSSFGVWSVRAVAAYRKRHPMGEYRMVAVDPSPHRFRQLEQNIMANNIRNATLLLGSVVAKGQTEPKNTTPGSVSFTLDSVLEPLDHVDYLDLDIQGDELGVFADRETVDVVNAKVHSVHIGTHSKGIHEQLRNLFVAEGWIKEIDYMHNMIYECDQEMRNSADHLPRSKECITDTLWGPMYIRDGLLSFFNPAFAAHWVDAFED